MSGTRKSLTERLVEVWWGKVLGGLLMMVVGIVTYIQFGELESGSRDVMVSGRLTGFVYDIGGRGVILGAALVLGAALAAWGIFQRLRVTQ